MDSVSHDALFRVLRQRLGYINVLPYIVAFNQNTADEQLNFILADDDRKQWQVTLYTFISTSVTSDFDVFGNLWQCLVRSGTKILKG